MNEELGLIFWCAICPLTFSSISELDDHVGVCHEEEIHITYKLIKDWMRLNEIGCFQLSRLFSYLK